MVAGPRVVVLLEGGVQAGVDPHLEEKRGGWWGVGGAQLLGEGGKKS